MAYHTLRRDLTFMRILLVNRSSAPLDKVLYNHNNVPMIIQSLGFNGYLSLIYSLIAHSITHPCDTQNRTQGTVESRPPLLYKAGHRGQ